MMSIASDIIHGRMPDFNLWLREGNTLDDIDEFGFTPLIESVLMRRTDITAALLERGVVVNKPDVTGRTALHWAVDNNDMKACRLLLKSGANPNASTHAGMSVLVYPILRGQAALKQLLYQHGARLDFAMDFINAKLLGHRFELEGDVDIVNADGEFVEVDYEGFILEFTVEIIHDSLRRFASSYATRHLRDFFPSVHAVMDGFSLAASLLKLQHLPERRPEHRRQLKAFLEAPLLVLPAASRGHAMGFVRMGGWWAKIDRGENSLREGSVNIYRITRESQLTVEFLESFLFKKQPRRFFHERINQILGLEKVAKLPITSQITGNCSWANMRAVFPTALVIQNLQAGEPVNIEQALELDAAWEAWDCDRALDECIQRFYHALPARKASLATMLGAVLFQSCNSANSHHLERAEKIFAILQLPEYAFVLNSYLEAYCIRRLSKKGNNLLQLLEACGINPGIGVQPVATRLKER